MGVSFFCKEGRKEGRKALADIAAAAAKTMIKIHTFPHLDNKQQRERERDTHTHTPTTQKRHIHTRR
jgi:hypothetical protein